MKTLHLLPWAALGSAFVVPDAHVFEHLAVEPRERQAAIRASWDSIKSSASDVKQQPLSIIDNVFDSSKHLEQDVQTHAADAWSWGQRKVEHAWNTVETLRKEHHSPPPPPPPPPHHGQPPCPGKPPHHGPHEPSNKTIYQLITESKHTSILAKMIADFPDLVEKLNNTHANYTLFAPTNKAFAKIPEHHPKPDRDTLEKILSYHVSPDIYSAGRVLSTHTLPTLLMGEHLSSEPRPQRLTINIGLSGLSVNRYSRIVAINIFGSNGVVHGVESILVPPPKIIDTCALLPTVFSTLELGLSKTGLLDHLNSTDHPGGTFFAPSNLAFAKLGPRINMFLFSPAGQKYLKALLLYHIATGTTLYSDAVYVANKDSTETLDTIKPCHKTMLLNKRSARRQFDKSVFDKRSARRQFDKSVFVKRSEAAAGSNGPTVPPKYKSYTHKRYQHYDLPTMLHDQKLNVDIAQYGPYIGMKVNGFSRVVIQDGVAQDGVIQVVSNVLIPPHNGHHHAGDAAAAASAVGGPLGRIKTALSDAIAGLGGRRVRDLTDRRMSLCEFKARFKGLVDADEE